MKKLAMLAVLISALSTNFVLASESLNSAVDESFDSSQSATLDESNTDVESMHDLDRGRGRGPGVGIGVGISLPGIGLGIGLRPGYHPGYPYPGRPYPGRPYPGRPYPGHPYPGSPYPVYPSNLTCSASDGRGHHFESTGPYSEDYLRREAYEQCTRSSGYGCYDTGCFIN